MEHQPLEQFFRTAEDEPFARRSRLRSAGENPLFKINPVRSAFYHPEALAIAALVGGAWAWALYSIVH